MHTFTSSKYKKKAMSNIMVINYQHDCFVTNLTIKTIYPLYLPAFSIWDFRGHWHPYLAITV